MLFSTTSTFQYQKINKNGISFDNFYSKINVIFISLTYKEEEKERNNV